VGHLNCLLRRLQLAEARSSGAVCQADTGDGGALRWSHSRGEPKAKLAREFGISRASAYNYLAQGSGS
jgi:hypothetical protein